MRESNSPMQLWCYACEQRASVMNLTANNMFQLEVQNPHMETLGEMGDISKFFQLSWYAWVHFCQNTDSVPYQKYELGRCMGPTKNEGNEMCEWILQLNVQIVPRRTLRRLRPEERLDTNEAKANKRASIDAAIKEDLGDSTTPVPLKPTHISMDPTNKLDFDEFDENGYENVVPEDDAVDSRVKAINKQSMADLLINIEVLLPQGEAQQMAKVIRQSIDINGNIIGYLDKTPSLKSLVYDVEFPDGAIKQYSANVIAEMVLSQVNSNGCHTQELEHIVLHERMGNTFSCKDAYITTKRGVRKLRQSTKGCKFLCEFKDGSNGCLSLKVLKESHPI